MKKTKQGWAQDNLNTIHIYCFTNCIILNAPHFNRNLNGRKTLIELNRLNWPSESEI